MSRTAMLATLVVSLVTTALLGCTAPPAAKTTSPPTATKAAAPPVGQWAPLAVDQGSGRQTLGEGELPLTLTFDPGGTGELSGTLPASTAGDKPTKTKATFSWAASTDPKYPSGSAWTLKWEQVKVTSGGSEQSARGLLDYLFSTVNYKDSSHELAAPNKAGTIYFMRVKR